METVPECHPKYINVLQEPQTGTDRYGIVPVKKQTETGEKRHAQHNRAM